MTETVNIHRTDGDSLTVGLPTYGLEDTRRDLIALRVKHGAETPIGHRCSNIIEMMKNGVNPARQVAELEKLLRDLQ